jgi:DNA-binding FrmR family transcriptional regulator
MAERKAVAVDPGAKERNLKRLRRIEGQVRGLQKMVEDDRYCADIMTLMKNHLRHCASSAIRSSEEEAGAMYDEIVDLMYRNGR